MKSVTVFADAAGVAAAAAEGVASALAGGAETLVLAGGTTPRRSYELLAGMEVRWGRVTVLFGDERCVPPDDPESNYRMAKEALLGRVAPFSVHRMPAELGAEVAAAAYDRLLAGLGLLDLVLLGVGPDGHTASLFPGRPELAAQGWAVAVHDAPKPPPDRVSLTLGTLQSAHRVLILATGADKADAVERSKRGEVPAGMIPQAEWLLDRAAAGAS
jgi:6-phosphogluconolactonase